MRVLDPQMTPQDRPLGGAFETRIPQFLPWLRHAIKRILLRGIPAAAAGDGTPCGTWQSRAQARADTCRAVSATPRRHVRDCVAPRSVLPVASPATLHVNSLRGYKLFTPEALRHTNYPSLGARAGESAPAVLGDGKLAARTSLRGMHFPPRAQVVHRSLMDPSRPRTRLLRCGSRTYMIRLLVKRRLPGAYHSTARRRRRLARGAQL